MSIYFIVTNDLSYDQRMIRVCTSLTRQGYTIKLVGRKLYNSVPLLNQPFQQKRITCFFNRGKLFYCEFNTRVFFYLLLKKIDCICAIDLDTILPCYFISKLKKIKRVYDAHELFCEMNEIVSRPHIYNIWKAIERYAVPKFNMGYTVSQPIADEIGKMYKVKYDVIRNITIRKDIAIPEKKERYILYQGAVNEGRSFETIIPAMKNVYARLIICGDGNFMQQAKQLVLEQGLQDKIIFKGYLSPGELYYETLGAWVGLNIIDDKGLNNYYSLANRFFDYMHAGIPQICTDFPAYREINEQFKIAVLVEDRSPDNIAMQINNLLQDEKLHAGLHENCMQAREVFNWQNEETKLIAFYKSLLG